MKKLVLFLVLISTVNVLAQVNVNSAYMKNPELAIGYVDSCAAFWFKAWDQTRGGFYTNVSKTGAPQTSWGTQKDMISQSRNAYGLTRAYMLTGKDEYLQKAEEALKFMYESAWDVNNTGWFNRINENGIPVDEHGNPSITENKTAFLQHYALLGISAYYEATNDSNHYNRLMDGYNSNETLLWDDDVADYGYYDYANYNWSSKNGKSFNATVDALTTHLLYFYLMNEETEQLDKIHLVTNNIMERLIPTMPSNSIGFAEKYYTNWAVNTGETMSIMGHVLKTAWCLARVHQLDSNQAYINTAETLIDDVLGKGYDNDFGGPYKDYNRITGEMLMWGNPDTAKAWWQMEQAVVAGLQMYDITGKEKYLQMADETTSFFMTHFVDHVYGEVYENRTKQGDETWGEHKGNGFKAGYHSIELGYYIYLYGNLLLHKEPVELYYNIEPITDLNTRELLSNPIAMHLDDLIISSVELNGVEYTNFDSENRLLSIDQNIGGEFKVTFDIDESVAVADNLSDLPNEFLLSQNYPNPFNPSTTIKYSIPVGVALNATTTTVSLKIYDILGREIATLVNRQQEGGNYEVQFDASHLSSGLYIYTITSGSFRDTKKMLLLR
jgi:mannose/cellobiose epimerase-like protein (N-acyl-D-glucosamine 2-epimerase family)